MYIHVYATELNNDIHYLAASLAIVKYENTVDFILVHLCFTDTIVDYGSGNQVTRQHNHVSYIYTGRGPNVDQGEEGHLVKQ